MRNRPIIPDLTQTVPRSPYEKLNGIIDLARMIDKARAKGAGKLGDYLYPCPLDQMLLVFLKVRADAFFEAVQKQSEDEILRWLQKRCKRLSEQEIQAWNQMFLKCSPEDDEEKARFIKMRQEIAPERSDVTTWVDLLELDEGRPVPLRTA